MFLFMGVAGLHWRRASTSTAKPGARQAAVAAELPDALDLLAVSVEAGLGFDGAVQKLTEHMDGPLIDEFELALGEMRIGEGRQEALKKMSERSASPEMASFVRAIIQADQLGISLGRILSVQAGDTRLKRQLLAEEKAMKAPIKMLFPTVVFIFPAMFIVILGPCVPQPVQDLQVLGRTCAWPPTTAIEGGFGSGLRAKLEPRTLRSRKNRGLPAKRSPPLRSRRARPRASNNLRAELSASLAREQELRASLHEQVEVSGREVQLEQDVADRRLRSTRRAAALAATEAELEERERQISERLAELDGALEAREKLAKLESPDRGARAAGRSQGARAEDRRRRACGRGQGAEGEGRESGGT